MQIYNLIIIYEKLRIYLENQICFRIYSNHKIKLEEFELKDLDKNEINNKLLKMADDLNIDFYKDIEDKLDMAKEKLNSLMP